MCIPIYAVVSVEIFQGELLFSFSQCFIPEFVNSIVHKDFQVYLVTQQEGLEQMVDCVFQQLVNLLKQTRDFEISEPVVFQPFWIQ